MSAPSRCRHGTFSYPKRIHRWQGAAHWTLYQKGAFRANSHIYEWSFDRACGILGLVQQIGSCGGNMIMKKILSLFLYITCILTLVACGKKAAPITLPRADEITSIDITIEENTVSHSDKTWISEVIADISSSEPTKKESVQDFPQVESYIKIDFRLETGTSTIFAYEDRGKYYLEQPYQGIYKIDRKLFERLKEIE